MKEEKKVMFERISQYEREMQEKNNFERKIEEMEAQESELRVELSALHNL